MVRIVMLALAALQALSAETAAAPAPAAAAHAAAPEGVTLGLKAMDGMGLAARLYGPERGPRPLIIVVPGFSQNKDTPIMRKVSTILYDYGDVLCLDLRGTGRSEGRYHFGSEEHWDVEAALEWARKRGRTVELMGLSMGGYIALRAASEFPGLRPARLYLISAPTSVGGIIRTLGPLRQALTVWFKKDVVKVRKWAGQDYFFRWGNMKKYKPGGEELAARLESPLAMLVGGRDSLVLPGLSRKVFDAAAPKKLWRVIPKAHHAEYIPVMNEREFREWFVESRNELSGAGTKRP